MYTSDAVAKKACKGNMPPNSVRLIWGGMREEDDAELGEEKDSKRL